MTHDEDFRDDSIERRYYDTSTRGTLRLPKAGCGHRIVVGDEPRHKHCQLCWFSFLQIHGEVTRLAEEIYSKEGEAALVQLKGRNFTKHFLQFMGALALWKQQTEKTKETELDEYSTGSIEGSEQGSEAGTQSGKATGKGDWRDG